MFFRSGLSRSKCNCDTNANIKFIFDTAIDDPEWKNPYDFGEIRKTILWKYDKKACACHNFIRNAPIKFIFHVAIDLPGRKVPIDFDKNWYTKMVASGHVFSN